jgi:4-cresol dehydrogenase (hydroxylating) flavoprotein subunit
VDLILPPSVPRSVFDQALREFAAVVGEDWVLATDEDRTTYMDAYAPGDGRDHVASAAVAPQSVEEVQAILRIANERKIPLWPVSRGKNLGYGEAAPLVSGSVVLDLGRMKRILEVNEKTGYVVIEPGVGFFDLYRHLQDNKIPLWLSVPANAWGSVIGNALERGLGYVPYGDNTSKLCGLEVVLPTGEILRTGMGAMAASKSRHNYQYGFGPHWDQLFVQSNFGVVTQAGMWLMPEPEATMRVAMELPHLEDISWFVDEMAQLRLRGVVQNPLVCGNALYPAMLFSQRDQWYKGPGALPDAVADKIRTHFGTGWWSSTLTLFGYADAIKVHAGLVRRAIEPHLKTALKFDIWHRGEPMERSGAGVPDLLALQVANWRGGRGGHIDFSPVMPPDGKLALEQAKRVKTRFDEFGFDYYASFTIGERHINNINMIVYDRDDAAMTDAARNLFKTLVADAARQGYGEYRTHLSFMRIVADTFDFNDHALLRLNERVKDALDPNGVLAPGKSGIWPKSYRESPP